MDYQTNQDFHKKFWNTLQSGYEKQTCNANNKSKELDKGFLNSEQKVQTDTSFRINMSEDDYFRCQTSIIVHLPGVQSVFSHDSLMISYWYPLHCSIWHTECSALNSDEGGSVSFEQKHQNFFISMAKLRIHGNELLLEATSCSINIKFNARGFGSNYTQVFTLWNHLKRFSQHLHWRRLVYHSATLEHYVAGFRKINFPVKSI